MHTAGRIVKLHAGAGGEGLALIRAATKGPQKFMMGTSCICGYAAFAVIRCYRIVRLLPTPRLLRPTRAVSECCPPLNSQTCLASYLAVLNHSPPSVIAGLPAAAGAGGPAGESCLRRANHGYLGCFSGCLAHASAGSQCLPLAKRGCFANSLFHCCYAHPHCTIAALVALY